MRLGPRPIVIPTRVAAPARPKAKPVRGRNGRLYLAVAAGLALVASAALLKQHWPKAEPAPPVIAVKKPDAAAQKQAGQIVIPRANTNLCDRYSFDNASGLMKPVATMPCSSIGKKQDINIADQVNSFHSSWRGSGPAPAPRGEDSPNAPRGETAR